MGLEDSLSMGEAGWLAGVRCHESPHAAERPAGESPSLLVVHCISLPEGEYNNGNIDRLFTGTLDHTAHPGFASLNGIEVSAHLLIARDGALTQYVSCERMAWHAGESSFAGRRNCNEFSIGVELEGMVGSGYDYAQYKTVAAVARLLLSEYSLLSEDRIVGHSDIAPGRKHDPGPSFDWALFRSLLQESPVA